MERAVARIRREAGGRVSTNVLVADLNVPGINFNDGRKIEVIVEGLPLYQGRQIAIDATFVSPLDWNGFPKLRSNAMNGRALQSARRDKHRTYHDIVAARRCHLLVAGIETGGRWSKEFSKFIRAAAISKARSAPPMLRKSMAAILENRWKGIISIATHRSYAMSVLQERMGLPPCEGGLLPDWSELQ